MLAWQCKLLLSVNKGNIYIICDELSCIVNLTIEKRGIFRYTVRQKKIKRTKLKVTQRSMQTQPETHANSLIQTHW